MSQILSTDIEFRRSEKMTDDADGGGRITGLVVLDNQENSVFDDISSLARDIGELSLRKVYWLAAHATDAPLLGANVICATDSDDPNVSGFIFTDQSWSSYRADYQELLERYYNRGGLLNAYLLGPGPDSPAVYPGFQAITLLQRPDGPIPDASQTLVLVTDEGEITEVEEFVRIKSLTHEVRTFYDPGRQIDYEKRVVDIVLTGPLENAFYGDDPVIEDIPHPDPPKSRIRDTRASTSIQVHGVHPITAAVEIGDTVVQVASVMTRVVPTGQTEAQLLGVSPVAAKTIYVPAGDPLTVTVTSQTLYLQGPVVPGSLTLAGTETLRDNGRGVITGSIYSGTVAYDTGIVSMSASAAWTVTWTPATRVETQPRSLSHLVTLENRALSFSKVLPLAPDRGSVEIHFQVFSKWYVYKDEGDLVLRNSAGTERGLVSLATSTVSATLEALPDVGSQIMVYWNAASCYDQRTGVEPIHVPRIPLDLGAGLRPASVTLTWPTNKTATEALQSQTLQSLTASGTVATATFAAAHSFLANDVILIDGVNEAGYRGEHVISGVTQTTFDFTVPGGTPSPATGTIVAVKVNVDSVALTGNGTGFIDYASGRGELVPATLPTLPATLTATYRQATTTTADITVTLLNHVISGTFPGAPLARKRAAVTWQVKRLSSYGETLHTFTARDNGIGGWVDLSGDSVAGAVNYTTGEFTLTAEREYEYQIIGYAGGGSQITTIQATDTFWGTTVSTQRVAAGAEYTAVTDDWPISIQVPLPPVANPLPWIWFNVANQRYLVDDENVIWTNLNFATGARTAAGTLDPVTRVMTLTVLPSDAGTLEYLALVDQVARTTVQTLVGRTAGAPLRVGQFQIVGKVADPSTTMIIGTADDGGDITGTEDDYEVTGTIDWGTGIFEVSYTTTGDVGIGMIPSEFYYNAVAYSQIILPQHIIGINAKRLPSDGMLRCFHEYVVIHHTAETAMPSPWTPNTTYALPRGRLSRVRVLDQDGLVVPADQWLCETEDLNIGQVRSAPALDLEGFVQPLIVQHTIEHGSLLQDLDIGGTLFLMTPSSQDFPLGAKVSGAILEGTLRPRATRIVAGSGWDGTWEDVPAQINPVAVAPNSVAYPPVLTGRGTVTQKWIFRFLNQTTFECIGDWSGKIGEGSINEDFAPINPYSIQYDDLGQVIDPGVPFFFLPELIWGAGGWAAGYVMYMETYALGGSIIVGRCVQPGTASGAQDRIDLWLRSDSNQ